LALRICCTLAKDRKGQKGRQNRTSIGGVRKRSKTKNAVRLTVEIRRGRGGVSENVIAKVPKGKTSKGRSKVDKSISPSGDRQHLKNREA